MYAPSFICMKQLLEFPWKCYRSSRLRWQRLKAKQRCVEKLRDSYRKCIFNEKLV